MALVLKDRVRETSTTTGTGTVTLGGAYDGYRTFASCVPTGSVVYYCIHNTATGFEDEWEVGYGTFTLSGTTLSRTSVMASSNSGSAVDFSAGTKEVFITYPAEKAIYEETNGETLIDGGPITVIGNGVTVTPSLPAELGKFVGNVDLFAQIYNMNQSDGSSASADFVAYNDLTTDGYTNFIDMGINSSTYTSVDYPIFTPGSGYLFHDGDKLFIGTATSNKDVVVFAGGVDTANVALTVSGTDQSVTLVGDLNVGGDLDVTGAATFGSTVTLNADPTLALQAATKQYVDNATSNGFHVHTPVLVATTGNLTATYNNGTSGVGATLTNSGAQAALSVDGVSMSVNDRVLVWQQTTGTQNGVYIVTTVGSGSTNWVLTRASDADTAGEANPNSLGGGDYFFVSSGATLGFFSFVCTNTDTITFGTTAITFTEFSQVPSYVVNAPLNLSGNVLSLTGTVAATNGGTGTSTVTTGDLLYGSGTNTWGKLAAGAGYKPLVMNAGGTAPEWNALALNQSGTVSGALPETHGGTNQTTYTLGDTLYSSAANTLSKLAGNTTTTKMYMAQTGNGSVSAAPVWAQVAAADISGLAASATTDTTNAANISSGTLPSGRLSGSYTDITGVGTLTAGTWTASTVGVGYGGTGLTSYTTGDIVYASASGTLASLADVATGNALISGGVGTAPSYGKIGLTTHITGTLAVSNGGTGATSLTGYVYGNGTSAMTASTSIPTSALSGTLGIANGGTGGNTSGKALMSLNGGTINTNIGGTTTFTNTSGRIQIFDGSLSNTVKLPDCTTTIGIGWQFEIINNSSVDMPVVSFDSSAVGTLTAGDVALVTRTTNGSSNTAEFWDFAVITTSAATTSKLGLIKLEDDTVQSTAANTVTTTASRTYGLQVNSSGQGVVNVPWTDTVYTLPAATSTVLGGVKLEDDTVQSTAANAVTTTASRTYGLQVNASGQGVVNVPWTDTVYTLPSATTTVLGGVKLGSDTAQTVAANAVTATASRSYAVQVNASGQAVVNVPWTDNNSGGTVTSITGGSYLTGGTITTSGTLAVDATDANTASKVVARDASGNFSAGTITATLSGNASTATQAGYVTGTNLGKTGAQGFFTTTGWTSTDWSNLPIGGGGMAIANTPGAPSTNYGFFIKTGNRDTGGGWGGIWLDYSGGDCYYGNTTVSSSNASWYKLAKADGTNASGTWSIDVTGSAGSATTATTANALNTSNNYQVNSLGVGTAGSGTAGEIRATNNITAYYSDDRLKTKLGNIENALDKVDSLAGFYYEANEVAQALGYEVKKEVGVSAQSVQAVMPEVVAPAPIDEKYLTVRYERLVPLLIEAIKELRAEVKALKGE